MQAGDQLFDFRVDERLATADRHHRGLALLGRGEALLERDHVLEIGGILADAATTGAGQVAGVKRLQLEDHRELRSSRQLVLHDVRGDFDRQGQGKTHTGKINRISRKRNLGSGSNSQSQSPLDRLNRHRHSAKRHIRGGSRANGSWALCIPARLRFGGRNMPVLQKKRRRGGGIGAVKSATAGRGQHHGGQKRPQGETTVLNSLHSPKDREEHRGGNRLFRNPGVGFLPRKRTRHSTSPNVGQ